MSLVRVVDPTSDLRIARFVFHERWLEVSDDLSYEEWELLVASLLRQERNNRWWLGDAWAFGEEAFHERSSQAVGAEHGVSDGTIRDCGWVSRKFQPSRRRDISWSHHREVSGLESEQADEWLANAKAGNWSHKDLRGRLKAAGLVGALDVHFRSDSSEWYTPLDVIGRTVRLLGEIDLDPCSNAGIPRVPAGVHYTAEEDGLASPWYGRVYMNPPYGDEIGKWAKKARTEYLEGNVDALVALVPARTDTGWWQDLSDFPVCFVRGRLNFSDSDTGAPFPSALIYLGPDTVKFMEAFGDMGPVYFRLGGEVPGE